MDDAVYRQAVEDMWAIADQLGPRLSAVLHAEPEDYDRTLLELRDAVSGLLDPQWTVTGLLSAGDGQTESRRWGDGPWHPEADCRATVHWLVVGINDLISAEQQGSMERGLFKQVGNAFLVALVQVIASERTRVNAS